MIYFPRSPRTIHSQRGRPVTPYLPSLGCMHVHAEVKPQGLGEGQSQSVPGPSCKPQVPADRHELQQICNHQAHLILHKIKVSGKQQRTNSGLRNCPSPSSFWSVCPDLPLKDVSKASIRVPEPLFSFPRLTCALSHRAHGLLEPRHVR